MTKRKPTDVGTNLGRYIRENRRGLSLTLRDVEDATDKTVSNAYLSQIENGTVAQPSPNKLADIARALGVPYQALALRAGYPDTDKTVKKSKNSGRSIHGLSDEEYEKAVEYIDFIRSRSGRE